MGEPPAISTRSCCTISPLLPPGTQESHSAGRAIVARIWCLMRMLKMFLNSFPFRILRLLDFSGLNCSRDHVAIFSSAVRIHRFPWIDGVITVTLSMKAQQAGCLMLSSAFGPLHCVPPAFKSRFKTAMNRATRIALTWLGEFWHNSCSWIFVRRCCIFSWLHPSVLMHHFCSPLAIVQVFSRLIRPWWKFILPPPRSARGYSLCLVLVPCLCSALRC